MTFTAPVLSLGWILALVILILDCILKALGMIELTPALVVAAICAWRP